MEEKRLWREAALMVPETLLLVGTSEGLLASINDACKLLGEDIWGSPEDDDDVEVEVVVSPEESTTGGGSDSDSGRRFGALLRTANSCGLAHTTVGSPLFTTLDGDQSYGSGFPSYSPLMNTTGGRRYGSAAAMDTSDGEAEIAPYDERIHNELLDAGFDHWANLLASAISPSGPLTAAHREITRLVALHGEAGHVLALSAARLGLRDDGPAWAARCDHRAAFLPNAHDALLRLSAAASATAAAEDFLRWRSPDSPRRSQWGSVARKLVGDARRDVLEARRAVELMRDAAVREFFDAWALLKRAAP
ncbi:uncharacterized protein LOC100824370 [Brachypodium distachyon]|uniref:Uncharacterized protein n=1 Tax=Brachypodium distachyon TaxID=15368 RepID=I1HB23_BRADI|nr:uncharacterized protein LOC100824370 [Brachypodium distachyon]KQK02245.1 hypothetical protein BRADI_2g00340v3 [Brachypodium distachyon]|eukprot:XP_003565208.2 uncharacterized protein LOC100824370 [Brachypodium distachyon]